MDRNIEPSNEMASKILESMTVSKPMSLSELNSKTGFSFGAILQCCAILVSAGILYRAQDGGKIFYIMLKKEYSETLERHLPRTESTRPRDEGKVVFSKTGEPQAATKGSGPKSSESKSGQKNAKTREALKPVADNATPSVPRSEATARVRTRSSVEERQSGQSAKETRSKRSDANPKSDKSSKSSELQQVSSQFSASLPNRNFPVSGSFKRVVSSSSSSHKAIFINNPTRPGPGATPSRSMYNSGPPVGFDPNTLRRSDTNLQSKASIEPRPKTPALLSFRPNVQSQNELTEEALREKLGISSEDLLLTLVVDRGGHELWTAFSAVANAGGGYIMLGIRKHGGTYFIKSITRAEVLVKSLIESFGDRKIISDSPQDSNYIKVIEFGRKKSILIVVDPQNLSNRPVYTAMDSFGTRTNDGCYIYRDGAIVRCTEDETKDLWATYIGSHNPDWAQESELPDIELKRRMKPVLPPIIDDAVRPLSRKTSTYGQPIPQTQHKSRKRQWEKPVLAARATQDATSSLRPASPRVPSPISAGPQSARFSPQHTLFSSLETSDVRNLVDEILLAEDIRVVKKPVSDARASIEELKFPNESKAYMPEATSNRETKRPKPDTTQANDWQALSVIAEPASKHARMPVVRLVEIVEALTRHTPLNLKEISELLGRRPAYIKDKVISKLQEDRDFFMVDDKYGWKH